MTRVPSRIDDLTCCRAVFACWVFIYHLNLQFFQANPFGPLAPWVQRGYLGVDGFFMLSGLVLAHAHPLLGLSRRQILTFWARRLARIYPVHFSVIVVLALLLVTGSLFGFTPREPGRFGTGELVRNLLLIHGWDGSARWAWNYPSWTISTEWAGYLAFPFLWYALRGLGTWSSSALLAVMLAVLAGVEAGGGGAGLNLTYRIGLLRFAPEFIAGALLAHLAPAILSLGIARTLPLLGAVCIPLAILGKYDTPVVAAMFMLLSGLFVRGLQGRSALLAGLPGFVFLGTISYSFYMSFAVIEMIQAVLWRRLGLAPSDHVVIFAVSSTAGTFAMAVLLWRFVEEPGRRLLRLAARPGQG